MVSHTTRSCLDIFRALDGVHAWLTRPSVPIERAPSTACTKLRPGPSSCIISLRTRFLIILRRTSHEVGIFDLYELLSALHFGVNSGTYFSMILLRRFPYLASLSFEKIAIVTTCIETCAESLTTESAAHFRKPGHIA